MPKSTILALVLTGALTAACAPDAPQEFGPAEVGESPAGVASLGAHFTRGPAGRIAMSWMERRDSGAALRYSVYDEGRWRPAVTVVEDPKMFVNWADMPSVMRIDGERWIAQWLSYSADKTYSYDVVVAQSTDGGRSWGDPVKAHTDDTPTEHGFVSMHREQEGVALLWLDGRDTGGEPTDNPLDTSMTLRAAVLTPDGRRLNEQLVDDSICDCCQTDVAVSSRGPIAVYRDRTADEVRDIYLTRYVDGHWQPGERIHADNWVIPGCPVNGPSIAARDDLVVISWFSAGSGEPIVRAILSTDGGATFAPPVDIAAGHIAGYLGTAILDEYNVAISWMARGDADGNPIHVRSLAASGQLGSVHTVGTSLQPRVVPQLARAGDELVLAWSDADGDSTRIVSARVPIRAH